MGIGCVDACERRISVEVTGACVKRALVILGVDEVKGAKRTA